jgi:hypothetical protein
MASSDITVDIRVVGQPECCRKLKEAGWTFEYQPSVKFIQGNNPKGGKISVIQVISISRYAFDCDEIGNAIAMLLNGVGE